MDKSSLASMRQIFCDTFSVLWAGVLIYDAIREATDQAFAGNGAERVFDVVVMSFFVALGIYLRKERP
jgi:hypothetical protein